jgi:hypothetical protein
MWTVLFFKGSIIFDVTVTAVAILMAATIPSAVERLYQISFKSYNLVPGPVL